MGNVGWEAIALIKDFLYQIQTGSYIFMTQHEVTIKYHNTHIFGTERNKNKKRQRSSSGVVAAQHLIL